MCVGVCVCVQVFCSITCCHSELRSLFSILAYLKKTNHGWPWLTNGLVLGV